MYKIKVISLKKNKDRRKNIAKLFNNISFEFYDGIDGSNYTLTKEDLNLIEGNQYSNYNIHIPSLVCANRTHLNLLTECSLQNVPYIIFEDDIEFTDNKLPKNYFESIARSKVLDAYWMIPKKATIAAYVVWPLGAKKMVNFVLKEYKLKKGLDWAFYEMRLNNKLKYSEDKITYFKTTPGKDSNITFNNSYKVAN